MPFAAVGALVEASRGIVGTKEGKGMKPEELELLLTVARILRGVRRDAGDGWAIEDVKLLDDALVPWDPGRGIAIDEEAA